MTRYKYYPPEVFSIDENRTRRNMEEYDRREARYYKALHEYCPEYRTLSAREQLQTRRRFEAETGSRI